MTWEEMVLSANQLADLQFGYEEPANESLGYERRIAKAQAKVSFEAGQLSGRQEVVSWIEKNKRDRMGWKSTSMVAFAIWTIEWQAKLKEWGIE